VHIFICYYGDQSTEDRIAVLADVQNNASINGRERTELLSL